MAEPSMFDKVMVNLRSTCKYYTGYPKDLGPSRVIHFTSEPEFVQLLHQGHPVVVAFTVECPKYPGFCITRQRKEYPFTEIFHSPEHAASQGRVADPNVTKYAVKVLPELWASESAVVWGDVSRGILTKSREEAREAKTCIEEEESFKRRNLAA